MNVQVKFNMIIQYMFSMHYEYDGLCIKLFTFIQLRIYDYYAVTNVCKNRQ